jgi:hypothetical protein
MTYIPHRLIRWRRAKKRTKEEKKVGGGARKGETKEVSQLMKAFEEGNMTFPLK